MTPATTTSMGELVTSIGDFGTNHKDINMLLRIGALLQCVLQCHCMNFSARVVLPFIDTLLHASKSVSFHQRVLMYFAEVVHNKVLLNTGVI